CLKKTIFKTASLSKNHYFLKVFSYPQSSNDDEPMQNDDDFDYGEDQSAPSPQIKSSEPALGLKINKTVEVTGYRGEDVVLKCDIGSDLLSTESVVVLWYIGGNVISNGRNVVQPNFKLDPNYDLTILKASAQNAGTYRCEVEPLHSGVNTKVVIVEHSLDAIAPESSTSAAGSLSSFLGWTILGSAILPLLRQTLA
ncbi:hypothetical protein KR009_006014, partial [Drosophila setifemur]